MTVRAKHYGHLEYLLPTEAPLAEAWFTNVFLSDHEGDIRNPPEPTHSTGTIFPPGVDNVTCYLDFEVHYEVDTQADIDDLVDELDAWIVGPGSDPGLIATARGESNTGTQGE